MNNHEHLVLIPGLMCDEAVWARQMGSLAQTCSATVASHGLADSLGGMADRILANAPPQFALAGHSMGGRVALEVMARAPARVTRLALLDTGYEGLATGDAGERERVGRYRLLDIARGRGMLSMAKEWARGMVHPSRLEDTTLMDSIHSMISRSTVEQFEAQIRALLARPDRTALLPALRLPVMVLCGHDDAWSPLARHEEMQRRIPGSWLVDVPEAGHMSTMEKGEAVSAAMDEWLRR